MDKSLEVKRDEAKKKAAQYENQVKILLNKQRDAERHARNHRLIVHGAIMEGVFPSWNFTNTAAMWPSEQATRKSELPTVTLEQ